MQMTFSQKFNNFEKKCPNEPFHEIEVVQVILKIKPERTVSLLAKFLGGHLSYRVIEEVEKQSVTIAKSITSMGIFSGIEATDFLFESWPIAQTLSDYCNGSQTLALTKISARSSCYDDIGKMANYKVLEFFSKNPVISLTAR